MDRPFQYGQDKREESFFRCFLICAVLFLAGCLAGTLSAYLMEEDASVFGVVSALLAEPPSPDVRLLFLRFCSFPFAAFLCGFTLFGFFVVPLLSAVHGFCSAFTLAVLIRCCSGRLLYAIGLFAPEALISVPCFLLLAAQAVIASRRLALSFGGQPYGAASIRRSAALVLLAGLPALLVGLVLPLLF